MIRRTTIGIAISVLLLADGAFAQESFQITSDNACSYYGENISKNLYSFSSDEQAKTFVARVMEYTGLPQNFDIRAANVPNAAAVIEGGKRYILYSQAFMTEIVENTRTDWSATSIMAHEIGHHLAGHTLDNEGSRPIKELEADRFSGHVLFKMGASLDEAKAAMDAAASEGGSSSHPPKSARLAAIHNGWVAAKDQETAKTPSPPQPEPEPDPDPVAVPLPDPDPVTPEPPPPPPPAPAVNIAGRWNNNNGSFLLLTQTGPSEYHIADYNNMGIAVGEGAGALNGTFLRAQILNLFVGQIFCDFNASANQLVGNCNGFQVLYYR